MPPHGANISLHAAATEDGGRGQVAHIAAQLATTVTDETRHGGHLTATRLFGPISYTVVSIPATSWPPTTPVTPTTTTSPLDA